MQAVVVRVCRRLSCNRRRFVRELGSSFLVTTIEKGLISRKGSPPACFLDKLACIDSNMPDRSKALPMSFLAWMFSCEMSGITKVRISFSAGAINVRIVLDPKGFD